MTERECGQIVKHMGSGTLMPITGFPNRIGAKTIAGPDIVYGTVASAVCGVVYWTKKTASIPMPFSLSKQRSVTKLYHGCAFDTVRLKNDNHILSLI